MSTKEPDHALQERLQSCPPAGSQWRHYKGAVYVIVGSAIIEQTLEPAVLYRRLDGAITWIRPLSDWMALVQNGDTQQQRFAPLAPADPGAT